MSPPLLSTVFSNKIQLIVNGVVQTGANWTVFGSGTSSNHVVLNTALQNNLVYTGTITATDVNGNATTNNFTFNTWLTRPTNLYIEAEDYNYSSGGWINLFPPPWPNEQDEGQRHHPPPHLLLHRVRYPPGLQSHRSGRLQLRQQQFPGLQPGLHPETANGKITPAA